MTLHQSQIVSTASGSGVSSSNDDAAAVLAAALQDDVLISKNSVDDDEMAEYIKIDQMDGASDELQLKSNRVNHRPVFKKMGLFGGAPSDDDDEYESADAGAESTSVISKSDELNDTGDKADDNASGNLHTDPTDFETNDEDAKTIDEETPQIKQEEDLNVSILSGPSASEQEAANILTTIKSGELLNSPSSSDVLSLDEK
jgi:hypothetical protein